MQIQRKLQSFQIASKKSILKRSVILMCIILLVFSFASTIAYALPLETEWELLVEMGVECKCDGTTHTVGTKATCKTYFENSWNDRQVGDLNIWQKAAYDIIAGANTASISNIDSLFMLEGDTGSVFSILWSGLKSFYSIIEPVGYLLVILYFVLDIIEQTSRDSFTAEHLIKTTIKLFLGVLFITNGLELLEGAADFSNSIIASLNGLGSGEGLEQAAHDQVYNMVKDVKWYDCVALMLNHLIPYIIQLFSGLVILIMMFSRYLDVAVRAIFAPIGMANIFEGGLNSSGMKYFKKYLSACLQGAIMCGIVIAGNLLANSSAMSGGLWGFPGINVLPQILIQLCVCAALVKSKSISNDLLGVN